MKALILFKNNDRINFFLNKYSSFLLYIALIVFCISWDGVFNFTLANDLRIDTSGLMSMFAFIISNIEGAKLHLGSDFIFPYGPLTFFRNPLYWPGLFWASLFLKILFITALTTISLVCVKLNSNNSIKYKWIIFLLYVWGFWSNQDGIYDLFFLLLLYFNVLNPKISKAQSSYLMFAASAVALIKFTFFLLYSFLLALFFIINILNKRSQYNVFIGILTLFGLFIYSGQEISNIWPYIYSSFNLAANFSQALSYGWIEPVRLIEICIFVISSVFILYLHKKYLIHINKDFKIRSLIFLFLTFWLFIGFKHGVVRHDGHAAHFATALILLSVLIALIFNEKIEKKLLTMLKVIIFLNILIFYHYIHIRPIELSRHFIGQITNFVGVIPLKDRLDNEYQQRVTDFKKIVEIKIPKGKTIDSWPDNAALAIFSDGNYHPRPMPFAFSAYSNFLSSKNAEFLLSDKAPDFLFFEVSSIDDHLPTMDDPFSWISILSNYDIHEIHRERLLLKKRNISKSVNIVNSNSFDIAFGKNIILPKSANLLLKATFDIQKTKVGLISNIFYKLPYLNLIFTFSDGTEKKFRLVNERLGFLISPFINNQNDFIDLSKSRILANKQPISMRVECEKCLGMFDNNFKIKLDEFTINLIDH